jgi:hypothetical protein
VSNPLRILQTLDRHLSAPAEITLLGRAGPAAALASARVPEAQEIRAPFGAAQRKVLTLVKQPESRD